MEGIREIISECLERVRQRVQERMDASGRNASGRTSKSLTVVLSEMGGSLEAAPSYRYMLTGRGAGPVPANFTDIIAQWITDKGISVRPQRAGQSQEAALRSMAGAIAYSIMKNGTRLHRQGGQEDMFTDIFAEEVERMGADMLNRVSVEVGKILKE